MSIYFYKTGHGERHSRVLGMSLAFGYFSMDDIDKSKKQLNFSIGFWWWVFQWQIWREE
jgi:hypothetical protein